MFKSAVTVWSLSTKTCREEGLLSEVLTEMHKKLWGCRIMNVQGRCEYSEIGGAHKDRSTSMSCQVGYLLSHCYCLKQKLSVENHHPMSCWLLLRQQVWWAIQRSIDAFEKLWLSLENFPCSFKMLLPVPLQMSLPIKIKEWSFVAHPSPLSFSYPILIIQRYNPKSLG